MAENAEDIFPEGEGQAVPVAGDGQLRDFIERIESLEDEKAEVAGAVREVYAEAKLSGYDPKIIRQVVRLRKMETVDRQEQEALLDAYMAALGMS